MDALSSISIDTWIQLIGTLLGAGLGAFLGGFYASKISKRQMDFNTLKEEHQRMNSFDTNLLTIPIRIERELLDYIKKLSYSESRSNVKEEYKVLLSEIDRYEQMESIFQTTFSGYRNYLRIHDVVSKIKANLKDEFRNEEEIEKALEELTNLSDQLDERVERLLTNVEEHTKLIFNQLTKLKQK